MFPLLGTVDDDGTSAVACTAWSPVSAEEGSFISTSLLSSEFEVAEEDAADNIAWSSNDGVSETSIFGDRLFP